MRLHHVRPLRPLFFAAFFFSVHLALLTYLNSSMLERFGDKTFASAIYTIAAALSFLILIGVPRIIRTIGLARTTIIALLASATLLVMIGTARVGYIGIAFFILYFSLNSLIAYLFDLFVEHYSVVESMGKTRGLYLFVQNIGWVAAPVLAGVMISTYGINLMYTIAAIVVIIALIIVSTSQRGFVDRKYTETSIRQAFRMLRHRPNIRRAITINLLLQLFYAWMVIYSPLYLTQLGFDWKQIGLMFSIMLLPFVLFQYPAGRLADRVGELPLMRIGLLIASLATLGFGIVTGHAFILYASLLFATRMGASVIEVACDSHFFKQITDQDAEVVGLYRTMLPLAYIIGPISGALIISTFSMPTLFIFLGCMLFAVMLYTIRLETR